MTSADISLYIQLFEAIPTENTKTGDSGTDENIENAVACDIDDSRGHVDALGTRDGHDVPTGVDQPGVEEVIKLPIARNAEYPFDTGDQMPPLTNCSSDSESESSCGESEARGKMKTRTKGYSANYIIVWSEETYGPDDDDEPYIDGGVQHSHKEKKKPQDRVSLLRNIYTKMPHWI